jgi:hypothetical protein
MQEKQAVCISKVAEENFSYEREKFSQIKFLD